MPALGRVRRSHGAARQPAEGARGAEPWQGPVLPGWRPQANKLPPRSLRYSVLQECALDRFGLKSLKQKFRFRLFTMAFA